MCEMTPTVSIVIPTRNRIGRLRKAVDSVQQQTIGDWELVVINDASLDDTSRFLDELHQRDSRVTVLTNLLAKGAAVSRNRGIEKCRGRWVAFLDDDDYWLPNKLERQLAMLSEDANAIACTCAYLYKMPLGLKKIYHPPQEIAVAHLLQGNVMGGASLCVCSIDILKRIGGFDEALRSAQDWDLWLRLIEAGKVISCREVLAFYEGNLGDRITRNPEAKYYGNRRFFFKHRHRMDDCTRQMHLARLCYDRSRLPKTSTFLRIRFLILAAKYASVKEAVGFVISSLPRIIFKSLRNIFYFK